MTKKTVNLKWNTRAKDQYLEEGIAEREMRREKVIIIKGTTDRKAGDEHKKLIY